jgi:hypothetical protein
MMKKKEAAKHPKPGPINRSRPGLRDNPLSRSPARSVVSEMIQGEVKPQLATGSTLRRLVKPVASYNGSELATGSNPELATGSNLELATGSNRRKSYRERGLVTVATRYKTEQINKIRELCKTLNIEQQQFFQDVASYALQLPMNALLAALNLKSLDDMASHTADHELLDLDLTLVGDDNFTEDDIIIMCRSMLGKSWTRRDDRVGRRYNDVDRRLLQIAFVTTIERKLRGNTARQPIKSFSYFTTEIELLLAQKAAGELPAALDEYHRYVMAAWDKRVKPLRDEKWAGRMELPPE